MTKYFVIHGISPNVLQNIEGVSACHLAVLEQIPYITAIVSMFLRSVRIQGYTEWKCVCFCRSDTLRHKN
jgi:hypothetical protein